MKQIEQVATQLIEAYNKAETMFAAAHGDSDHIRNEYARIIGTLQGDITIAIIYLGKYDTFCVECRGIKEKE